LTLVMIRPTDIHTVPVTVLVIGQVNTVTPTIVAIITTITMHQKNQCKYNILQFCTIH
jgi:hypothetical protein